MFFSDDLAQCIFFFSLLTAIAPFLGRFFARVFQGDAIFLQSYGGGLERLCYRVSGANYQDEMTWKEYGKALFWFNIFGFIA
ncbi:MAG TPA: potassium-transporting ATPase subunit KdpA, partial [Chlamydiales bacterium]|nr:potassium-transporting ATPase subunit KdpA [Chlamydiales bacterium]